MTVREAINANMQKYHTGDGDMLTICFPKFLMGMANLLCVVSDEIIDSTPNYVMKLFGEDIHFQKKEDRFLRLLPVLCGDDILRGGAVFLQLQEFMSWYLDQDAFESVDGSWYDARCIAEKWNEFAELEAK